FTAGWRFATSPRNSPTRPPPMMASPMSAAWVLMATTYPLSFRGAPKARTRNLYSAASNHRHRGYGFRARSLRSRPGMTVERSHSCLQRGVDARPVLRLEVGDCRDRLVGQRQVH